ncbi:MAG: hypothetical protein EOQ39_23700 [Mesorhizobium sp.]|uniref:hypothetical protein n=1 Tax=Mesorhizobium sp. TaxID=1871066 RepID=UPI000FE94141|nr:hypothetical protein [Mesorhizobium sp.]RWA97722.1 MAG: hypothetical protein EOQ37_34390 [Mesorhizobium sp.]RWB12433.1 MAG: hypothetical protein EOQ39_23700 [Mesorhizobium sp.]
MRSAISDRRVNKRLVQQAAGQRPALDGAQDLQHAFAQLGKQLFDFIDEGHKSISLSLTTSAMRARGPGARLAQRPAQGGAEMRHYFGEAVRPLRRAEKP